MELKRPSGWDIASLVFVSLAIVIMILGFCNYYLGRIESVESLSLGLAMFAIAFSIRSFDLALSSEKKMKALGNSQIDEKHAMMARYVGLAQQIATGQRNPGLVFNDIRAINSNLNALFDLKEYTSKEKRNELVKEYIVEILRGLMIYRTSAFYIKQETSESWDDVVADIGKTAKDLVEKEAIKHEIDKIIRDAETHQNLAKNVETLPTSLITSNLPRLAAKFEYEINGLKVVINGEFTTHEKLLEFQESLRTKLKVPEPEEKEGKSQGE